MVEKIEASGYTISRNGIILNKDNSIKKLSFNKSTGYFMAGFFINGKGVCITIHRLLALKFIHNPTNKPQVNHIIGVKTDNRIENLEWVTASENRKHAYDIGLMGNVILSSKKTIKVATLTARAARRKKVIDSSNGKIYDSAKETAEILGLNYQTLITKLSGNIPNKTSLRYLQPNL